jgi:hypothetical protein
MIKKKINPNLMIFILTVTATGAGLHWQVAERFIEGPKSSYYQARIAFERSGDNQKKQIRDTLRDNMISMYEYSEVIFPAYMRVIKSGESPLPIEEKAKSLTQLNQELIAAVNHRDR